MHKTYKANTQKFFDTKSDPHIALLQIRSTPLGLGLPSPATLLFNHPIRGIMAIIYRPLVCLNNDASIPIGSAAVAQCEDGGLWIHGTIEGKGDHTPQ